MSRKAAAAAAAAAAVRHAVLSLLPSSMLEVQRVTAPAAGHPLWWCGFW
jgi:hypothetical protein